MLDIRFVRENPEAVKENIKKKFEDEKLPLVDEVLDYDRKNREAITEASSLRAARNTLSKQIGMLMGQAKKDPSKRKKRRKFGSRSLPMLSAWSSWNPKKRNTAENYGNPDEDSADDRSERSHRARRYA